jgi:MFS family permease
MTAQQPPHLHIQTRFFWLWFLLPMVGWFAFYLDVIAPVLPAIGKAFQLPPEVAQQSMSLFYFTCGITQWVMGRYTHLLTIRGYIYLLYGIMIIGTLLVLDVHTWWIYMLGRLLQAIGSGSLLMLAFIIVRNQFNDETLRQKLCGQLNATIAGSLIIMPPLGASLYHHHQNWHSPYWYLFAGITLHLLSISILKPTFKEQPKFTAANKAALNDIPFGLASYLFICGIAGGCYNFIFLLYSPYLMIETLHMSVIHYGWMVAGLGCIHVSSCYLYPYFAQAVTAKRALFISHWLFLLSGGCMLISAYLHHPGAIIMAFGIAHIASGILLTGSISVLLNHPKLKSDQLLGTFSCIKFIIPPALASLAPQTVQHPAALAAMMICLAGVCFISIPQSLRRSDAALIKH